MTKSHNFSKQSAKQYSLLTHTWINRRRRLIKENTKEGNSVILFRAVVEEQCVSVTTPTE